MSFDNLGLEEINGGDYVSPDPINNNFEKVDALGIDYIIESGTSGEWWYRKWKSGRAECGIDYKDFGEQTLTMSSKWGNAISASMTFGAYPITFASRPYTMISFEYDALMAEGRMCTVITQSNNSVTTSPGFKMYDATAGTAHPYFGIYVNGRYA